MKTRIRAVQERIDQFMIRIGLVNRQPGDPLTLSDVIWGGIFSTILAGFCSFSFPPLVADRPFSNLSLILIAGFVITAIAVAIFIAEHSDEKPHTNGDGK